ncbi:unnamed protein product [Rotaria socialis]|uniref:F-box domain-containing protein n=1 Tax=Rotaria socialis TaxID=392032 RepID=A0A820UNN3_9BILA|nr:unnamed protein product [Rotaria socialis]
MATTLEHLSVELLYEIFIYFQFHEVFNIFSKLNSKFAAIIHKTPLMSVYLGFNGMSIALTEFYYRYLSQPNIDNRLISLDVSDTLAIDNGLWSAENVSTFINLRHLLVVKWDRGIFEKIFSQVFQNRVTPINRSRTPNLRYLNSNGLRQLYLSTGRGQPDLINIAYLIVERLPHLQIIELNGANDELIKISHILSNGLSKLNFLKIIG